MSEYLRYVKQEWRDEIPVRVRGWWRRHWWPSHIKILEMERDDWKRWHDDCQDAFDAAVGEETTMTLEVRHAQNDRWYVVDRHQNTYGQPGGYATREEAEACADEWLEEDAGIGDSNYDERDDTMMTEQEKIAYFGGEC